MVDSNGRTYCCATKNHFQTINNAIDETKSNKLTEINVDDVKIIQSKIFTQAIGTCSSNFIKT